MKTLASAVGLVDCALPVCRKRHPYMSVAYWPRGGRHPPAPSGVLTNRPWPCRSYHPISSLFGAETRSRACQRSDDPVGDDEASSDDPRRIVEAFRARARVLHSSAAQRSCSARLHGGMLGRTAIVASHGLGRGKPC